MTCDKVNNRAQKSFKRSPKTRDFPGGAVVKTLHSQCRGPEFDLDPTCMPQLRVRMPQLRSPSAATKTRCNQINKQINIKTKTISYK